MQFILNKKQIQPYLYLLPVLRELNDKNINLSNEVFLLSILRRQSTYKTYTKYLSHDVKNERKNKKIF